MMFFRVRSYLNFFNVLITKIREISFILKLGNVKCLGKTKYLQIPTKNICLSLKALTLLEFSFLAVFFKGLHAFILRNLLSGQLLIKMVSFTSVLLSWAHLQRSLFAKMESIVLYVFQTLFICLTIISSFMFIEMVHRSLKYYFCNGCCSSQLSSCTNPALKGIRVISLYAISSFFCLHLWKQT